MNAKTIAGACLCFGIILAAAGNSQAQQCPPTFNSLDPANVAKLFWPPAPATLPTEAFTNTVYYWENSDPTTGAAGTQTTRFLHPTLVASKGDGSVTVYDPLATPNLITMIQTNSSYPRIPASAFVATARRTISSNVTAMLWDSQNRLWVLDPVAATLSAVGDQSLITKLINLPLASPKSMTFDGTNMWIPAKGGLLKVDLGQIGSSPGMNPVTFIPVKAGAILPAIASVVFDGSANIWALIQNDVAILQIPVNGGPPSESQMPDALTADSTLLFDGANLWVNAANSLVKIVRAKADPTGRIPIQLADTQRFTGLEGMTYDAAGSVWVADHDGWFLKVNACSGQDATAYIVNPQIQPFTTSPPPTPQIYPTGIAFDGSSMWFISPSTGTVSHIRF